MCNVPVSSSTNHLHWYCDLSTYVILSCIIPSFRGRTVHSNDKSHMHVALTLPKLLINLHYFSNTPCIMTTLKTQCACTYVDIKLTNCLYIISHYYSIRVIIHYYTYAREYLYRKETGHKCINAWERDRERMKSMSTKWWYAW